MASAEDPSPVDVTLSATHKATPEDHVQFELSITNLTDEQLTYHYYFHHVKIEVYAHDFSYLWWEDDYGTFAYEIGKETLGPDESWAYHTEWNLIDRHGTRPPEGSALIVVAMVMGNPVTYGEGASFEERWPFFETATAPLIIE